MSLSSLIRDSQVNPGYSPIEYSYTYEGDIAAAAFEDQRWNMNASSVQSMMYDEYVTAKEKYTALTNEPFTMSSDESLQGAWTRRADRIIEQNRLQGLEGWAEVPTSSEINEKAKEKARQARLDYDSAVARAAPGVWKRASSFAGGMAGWFSDPFQTGVALATAPLGGTIAGPAASMLRIATVEGLVGAAEEAAYQPTIMAWQKEVGHEYTLGDAMTNVAFAGGAGFGLSYGLMALARAKNFKGFGPDEVSKIFNLSKKESLNESPRIQDAEGELAKTENVRYAISEMEQRRMPDPAKFNPSSSARVFNEDAVTFEHAQVAQKFIESGAKKSELDVFGRQAFIDEMKREFSYDANLPRYDIGKLRAKVSETSKAADDTRAEIKAALAEARALDNVPANEAVLEKMAANKLKTASLNKKLETQLRNIAASEKKIQTTATALDADNMLARLANNEIPLEMNSRYTTYKKNLKSAFKDIQEYEAKVRQTADAIFHDRLSAIMSEGNPVRIKDAQDAVTKMDDPELAKVEEQDFKRDVKDALTGADEVIEIDGVKMKMSEIMDEINEDEDFMKQLGTCITGGK